MFFGGTAALSSALRRGQGALIMQGAGGVALPAPLAAEAADAPAPEPETPPQYSNTCTVARCMKSDTPRTLGQAQKLIGGIFCTRALFK